MPMTAQTTTPKAQDPWTTRKLLAWMTKAFEQHTLDSPRLSAEILLGSVINCDRLRLYMENDRPASPEERETLRGLVKRALNNEPIQYLTGEARFFALDFKADRRALIPRPSTETIIERVLQSERTAERTTPVRIAEICTGSGCIAVSLAKNLPQASIIATDISPDAISLAAENAERHSVESRIEFREGDMLDPIAGSGPFDWIVSNPPYIPDDEWDAVEPNVKDHEPHLALRASPDGLPFVKNLIENARPTIAQGGTLMIELAAKTAAQAAAHACAHGWANPEIIKDHEDLDRVLLLKNR